MLRFVQAVALAFVLGASVQDDLYLAASPTSLKFGKFVTLCVLSKTNNEEVRAAQVEWSFSLKGIEVVSPTKDGWQVEAGVTNYDGDDATVFVYARLTLAGNLVLLTSYMDLTGMPCWYSRTYCGEALDLISLFPLWNLGFASMPLVLAQFSPTQIYWRMYESGFEVYGLVARLQLESFNCFGGEGELTMQAFEVTIPPGVTMPVIGPVPMSFFRDRGHLNLTVAGQRGYFVEMRGGAWFPDLDQIASTTVNHNTPRPCVHVARIDSAL
eukprot:Gregarina_sp_Pseudo_9__640@NODE_1407_length_1625_cov_24_679697_g1309_i0_p1_GENE_NODE_1407_length_1625_cov_24_679697_g1309_i0NODE_1407_length_1625_cov_24_679697_g1309_i0_p1_ORF_typecomplete_len269_score25_98_NODE_1407_length_1625_cov_24_679697_g1309_i0166972